jgi:hypothetical protein
MFRHANMREWCIAGSRRPGWIIGPHSMRRTKATLIYKQTKNLRAVQLLFGYTNGCHPKPLTKTANRGAYASTSATCVTPVILLSQLHRQQWPRSCRSCHANGRQLTGLKRAFSGSATLHSYAAVSDRTRNRTVFAVLTHIGSC